MNDIIIRPYELWYAKVAHEDNPTKVDDRPVVVIDAKHEIYAALKVTRTQPRENFWGEYSIKRWQQAGLTSLSTIRISKFLKLEIGDFRRKIGMLRMVDIAGIQNYIDRIYKNVL